MTSEAVFNPKCYTDDSWVVHISENLLHENEHEDSENSHGDIRVLCRVPKSLRSANPEAFIPQFVGLGPYHHCRPKLTVTEDLKLAAARRALKDGFHLDSDQKQLDQRLKKFVPVSDIKARYQIDVSFTYSNETLLYVLVVDGLFLLGLLHRVRDATANPEQHCYFLTGENDTALVNADGVELTMDFIFRDVFMLENQIPTHFLKKITESVMRKEIQPLGDLGSTMLNFCKELCPFVQVENLPSPEEHHHLLDLMYHLIVVSEPTTEPDSMPEPETKPERDSMPEPKLEHRSEGKDNAPTFRSTTCGSSCCMICLNILIFLVVVCLLLGFICRLILRLILWMVRSLIRMVPWALGRLVGLSKKIGPQVARLHGYLSKSNTIANSPPLSAFRDFVGKISEACNKIGSIKVDKDARPTVTIPSVTELYYAGIHFRPAQGGISSIKFNEENCQFHLPKIKVNVNSEVIFRNLVAYETLTKTKGLIFTRYIEIMRAIIDTPQDVKLLVQNEIIDTQLSDEVVAQLFNGMSKSIRPTEATKLDDEIKKVNKKFDSTQWLKRAMIMYMYSSWQLFTVIAALVFLVLTAVQTYCSVFGCSPASKSVTLPEDASNNIFMSSV